MEITPRVIADHLVSMYRLRELVNSGRTVSKAEAIKAAIDSAPDQPTFEVQGEEFKVLDVLNELHGMLLETSSNVRAGKFGVN